MRGRGRGKEKGRGREGSGEGKREGVRGRGRGKEKGRQGGGGERSHHLMVQISVLTDARANPRNQIHDLKTTKNLNPFIRSY